jgi:hypothetical protein
VSDVQITPLGGGAFRVVVTDGETTNHRVTVSPAMLEGLGIPNAAPEAVIRESFAFLLEREPNTSILPDFPLEVISRYFPEYREELLRRLA